MPIERLVLLTQEYPSSSDPIYPFVQELARGFAGAGVRVTVIAPLSLTRVFARRKKLPGRYVRESDRLTVLRPLTLSFSTFAPRLNQWLFERAVRRAIPANPDALYGHFLAPSGMCAARLGAWLRCPSFLGYGESSPRRFSLYSAPYIRRRLKGLTGVVAVSGENAREFQALGLADQNARVGVFPNGANPSLFRPGDRFEARRALGFPQDAFIVGFVGAFSPRKGVGRLCEALRRIPSAMSVFIGRGEAEPDCPNILFKGALPHEDVPLRLAACDLFVLPTLAEGCCNAIVEALCMGLPVVSSALPFNDDLLNEGNSIRIDPADTRQIEEAIRRLMDDPALLASLRQGALASAKELSIAARVQKILRFMEGFGCEGAKTKPMDSDVSEDFCAGAGH